MRPSPLAVIALLATLWPGLANAGDPYGSLELVQVRRAGFLEEVQRSEDAVVVQRDGVDLPAERGMAIHEGDVLVTDGGSCVVATPEGWRVTVGEGSEVEVRSTWVQRLGTAIYRVRASFGVKIERVEVLVEGTVFAVTWDGDHGEVAVLEGVVRVWGDAGEEAVIRASERVSFTTGTAGGVVSMELDAVSAVERLERRLGSPNGGLISRGDRLRIGLGGGLDAAQGRTWGAAGARARVRLAGPLWSSVSAGLLFRRIPSWDGQTALAIPLALGLHVIPDLPGGAFASLGGSLDVVVGDRCGDPVQCQRSVAAEPGGTVDLGVGFHLGGHLAFALEARLGAGLRHEYGEALQRTPDAVVAPRLGVNLWLEVRP